MHSNDEETTANIGQVSKIFRENKRNKQALRVKYEIEKEVNRINDDALKRFGQCTRTGNLAVYSKQLISRV